MNYPESGFFHGIDGPFNWVHTLEVNTFVEAREFRQAENVKILRGYRIFIHNTSFNFAVAIPAYCCVLGNGFAAVF